jgi:hypothetical protein
VANKNTASPETALQKENSQLKELIRELKKENLNLQKKIAKIEAQHVTAANRIEALEKLKDPHGDIEKGNKLRAMSDDELNEQIKKISGDAQKI